jgi:hypothetical protein
MKEEIKELIGYVNDWVYSDMVGDTTTYKLMDIDDRKIYAFGWKMGCKGVLEKLEEINRKYEK